ncbi:ICE-like protease (caspase) p20 domain protein [Plesiocystis pacifica SIR-1]|uniref:ICE-like protease (Caspase) p20 domain protein n=1 Tax=Plesiocystis pacifica SIR-1 TaxID=391625 RepID=A6G4T7_9BACT|nr:caspase family protein [Plesiocystis pacifica]EDM79029.1 ICE-like protease (caspase) p20 domain protein [Plesiocystis pacifica SIR-1]
MTRTRARVRRPSFASLTGAGLGVVSAVVAVVSLGAPQLARAGQPGLVQDAVEDTLADSLQADSDASVRRYALFVGANDGGVERERLLYAVSDVQAMAKALSDLGGLASSDRIILEDPTAADLERGFQAIAERIAASRRAGERVQFVFYYSGHSDETGLLLGGVHVDYKSLRAAIDRVPADVRIGVLDSCSSGAFTRFKGGRKRAPFLVGTVAEVQGHAYLTSSSADEAAQESDRIGGSFFTHFLVTGLRGAADADGDRRVTLDEAYRFAFDETLARTETTAGGPQHAAYDIELAGTGDLVMTDLRTTTARLEIAAPVHGRIYVRDRRGKLAAELFKARGSAALTLALEPGDYSVTIDDGQTLSRAEVSVRAGRPGELALEGVEDIPVEGTRSRGSGFFGREGQSGPKTHVPFNLGAGPKSELNAAFEGPIRNNLSLSVGVTDVAVVQGMQAALGMARTREPSYGLQAGVGAAVAGELTGAQVALGYTQAQVIRGLQEGTVSVATERVDGVQAGLVSYAGEVRGVQVGLVSVAGQGTGLQGGLVNVTRGEHEGVQIGLINYADEADVSLGLIPYTKKGGVWLDVYTSDTQVVNLALRLRARKSYTFFGAGVHPLGDDAATDPAAQRSQSWSVAMGFGGPLLWRRWVSVELDNAVGAVFAGLEGSPESVYFLDTLRLSVAFRPARHFAIWAAPTLNLMIGPASAEGQGDFRPGYGWSNTVLTTPASTTNPTASPGTRIDYWPGFAVGFEF